MALCRFEWVSEFQFSAGEENLNLLTQSKRHRDESYFLVINYKKKVIFYFFK